MNPDPKESNLDVIPADVLALWQGKGGRVSQDSCARVGRQPTSDAREFLVVGDAAGFGVALAESVVASRYLGVQREET